MSTEQINTEPIPPVDPYDCFLQLLVNMANNYGFEFGITLQVSGFLVSGVLIGHKAYFEAFAEDFSSAFPVEDAEKSHVRSTFAKIGETDKNEDNNEPPLWQYIHLKDTRFFNTSGNPIPKDKGVLWRGRISEIGGFTLGSLT